MRGQSSTNAVQYSLVWHLVLRAWPGAILCDFMPSPARTTHQSLIGTSMVSYGAYQLFIAKRVL